MAVNFKIDTGMGRMGVPEGEALDVLKKVSTFPQYQDSQRFDSFASVRVRTRITRAISFCALAKS